MTDSPSSTDGDSPADSADDTADGTSDGDDTDDDAPDRDESSERVPPHRQPSGPPGVGAGLLREAVLAWIGVLVLLAGLNGWWFFLHGGGAVDGYSFGNLLGDLAYSFAGVYLLFVAVGSAAERLHRKRE